MYSPCTPFVFLTCQCVSYRQHTAPPSYIHATHSYLYFLYCMLHVKQMSPINRLLPHILLCTYHVSTITTTYILLLTMYATRYPPPSVYVYVLVCMYYLPIVYVFPLAMSCCQSLRPSNVHGFALLRVHTIFFLYYSLLTLRIPFAYQIGKVLSLSCRLNVLCYLRNAAPLITCPFMLRATHYARSQLRPLWWLRVPALISSIRLTP